MPDTPLNPEALEAASDELLDRWDGNSYDGGMEEIAEAIVTAYLAVAQPEVNSVEWTLDKLRANFEWGGQIHNDPAEFDRVINQVRAQALTDLADQMRDRFTASWIRGKAREYTHGPHKIVGAFAKPVESEADCGDQD